MTRMRWTLVLVGMLVVSSAVAQTRPIQWISNASQGVAAAQRAGMPVMFYISGEGGQDNSDLERDIQRTFRDKLFVAVATEHFVPVRLPLSTETEKIMAQIGAPKGVRLSVVCATADGKLLGILRPGQLQDPQTAAQQLMQLFSQYRSNLYQSEVQPVLEDENAKPADLMKALKKIEKYTMLDADAGLAKLLEGDNLTKTLKKRVFGALAKLSTTPAVTTLLKHATTDKTAALALQRCEEGAGDELATALDSEDFNEFLAAYTAITKIFKLKAKPKGFWSGQNERLIAEEIQVAREAATNGAKQWDETFGKYR